ncbi:MAG: ABC transporter permease [Desulfobacteraceae bacterium]|nr:MAG: ABC transporter permease [Desulfobacteraceae bacterium]
MKLYNISLGNLSRRKSKVLFLVMGLVIGISTVVTLLSISKAMTLDIEERLNQFGANIVMIPRSDHLSLSYGGVSLGGVDYQVKEFEQARLSEIRAIKNAKNIGVVAPKVLGQVDLMGRGAMLMGVVFEEEMVLKTWWQTQAGGFPRTLEELLVGSYVAQVLKLEPGQEIQLGGQTFKVAGILKSTGGSEDHAIISHMEKAQAVLNKPGKVTLVEIAAFCQGCPINELTLQIAEKFPNAKVTAMKQAVMSKMQSIELFRSFSLGVSVMVIFIGALLVLVTMMGSVKERTREIGIFRAIGFRKGHVMQIILLEAVVLGVVGGFAGVAVGNALAWLVIPLVMKGTGFAGIDGYLGLASIVLSVALSLAASFYPAIKASNLDPSDALRVL